ncbi:MAG: argininosuccinate lyase [Bacteroidaceae bacterium]|nr:argininosuccinate lyase [Bacteroidaceae bacterium]
MAKKLWEKSTTVNPEIERFTIGKDRELDLLLARYDILGSIAHSTMLRSIGMLTTEEMENLHNELRSIYEETEHGNFVIEEGVEDVHSQVELMLTRKLGDTGKKIHSGRSRNDQVLVDLKLFTRNGLQEICEGVMTLFGSLIEQSEKHKDVLMPGYTHLQVAMPSSFGLWFGAYAESLADDMLFLKAAYSMCNRNPLGSAAGYGSSFPLNRTMTTELLGFDSMNYNVVYAQMGRGKCERNVAYALASVAGTLAKLAFDACMFNSQNFGFIKLPAQCTTGSSIMPHKKNPDVFELLRAKCNRLQALPTDIILIMNNLPSGYFRDLQIIKELFLPAFSELKECIGMATYIVQRIEANRDILSDQRYDAMFSVEEVNRLALEGMPFRDAYKKVGLDIEAGNFAPDKNIRHTHEGSIGNLCNEKITELMHETFCSMDFEKARSAERALLKR